MRLLKILFVIFLIYFVRRFLEMYKVMKSIQEQQMKDQKRAENQYRETKNENVISADFKVID